MFPVFLSVITTRHTTKIRIYPLQMLYIFIIFELLFYLHISKYSVGVTTGIFEVTWHSPQLKQGILVSSTTALTNTLRYCNVLYSVHKLCLSCSRMPCGTAFHLYADCICSAFFRILMPAFVSRSWTAWHFGHSQIRMLRFFIRGFL